MKLFLFTIIFMIPTIVSAMMFVPISEVSSSGRTLTLDLGIDDGIEEGGFIVLVGPGSNQNQDEFTELKVIGTAKVVKPTSGNQWSSLQLQ